MYIVFVRSYFGEKSASLKAAQSRDCQVNRDFAQNGRRKYDGETSEGVPYSLAYSSLKVRSHLTVKIVAPWMPDSKTPQTTVKCINRPHVA